MFIPDMPNVPDQYLQVVVAEARPAAVSPESYSVIRMSDVRAAPESEHVMLAQATLAQPSAATRPKFTLKECQEIESIGDPMSAMRALDPAYMLKNFLRQSSNRIVELKDIKTSLIEEASHGKVIAGVSSDSHIAYRYEPIPEYVGKDKAVFMAELNGKFYKIVVELIVQLGVDEQSPQCGGPKLISSRASGSGLTIYTPNVTVGGWSPYPMRANPLWWS